MLNGWKSRYFPILFLSSLLMLRSRIILLHSRIWMASVILVAKEAATDTSWPFFTRTSIMLLIRGVPPPLMGTNCSNMVTRTRITRPPHRFFSDLGFFVFTAMQFFLIVGETIESILDNAKSMGKVRRTGKRF